MTSSNGGSKLILYCGPAKRWRRHRREDVKLRSAILVVLNLLAIIICGGLGGVVGFTLIRSLGVDGVTGAIVATFVAMVVATAAWAAGATLLRALRLVR